LVPASKIIRGY